MDKVMGFAIDESKSIPNDQIVHLISQKKWDPKEFLTICESAVSTGDSELTNYCNKIVQFECSLISRHLVFICLVVSSIDRFTDITFQRS
jgi:hypothetical protein